jgi:hypothetical protein
MLFFETSAKSGHNIENVFTETAKIINSKIEQDYYDLASQVVINNPELRHNARTWR